MNRKNVLTGEGFDPEEIEEMYRSIRPSNLTAEQWAAHSEELRRSSEERRATEEWLDTLYGKEGEPPLRPVPTTAEELRAEMEFLRAEGIKWEAVKRAAAERAAAESLHPAP